MSFDSLNWYRITFHDSELKIDTKYQTGDLTLNKEGYCSSIYESAISKCLDIHPGLKDIVENMGKKGVISHVVMTANSVLFGCNALRCSYVFPDEVFVPSRHKIETGTITATKADNIVSLGTRAYLIDYHFKIGVSKLEPGDINALKAAKPQRFVGMMDSKGLESGPSK